jgi:predicted O-methyltransferase YrrM
MNQGWALPSKAFQWIENNIPFGRNIVELGSGNGSSRLSENYQLWSIEHDEAWLHTSSSNYIHAEIIPYSVNGLEGFWYNREKIEQALPKEYDLLIIDGPPSSIGRNGVLVFHDLFDWSGYILIDDTHRAEDKLLADQIASEKSLNQIHFTEYFEPTDVHRQFTILTHFEVNI